LPDPKLDTLRPIAIPEGAEIALRIAGPSPRALAWALDALLRGLGYAIVGLVFAVLGQVGLAAWLIVLFVGEWGYGLLFEVLGRGATPGKRVLGLRVVHSDGTPVSWGASAIRNFMLFVDFLPPPFGAGLVACLASPNFQRLGDLAAGTLVVHDRRVRRATERDVSAPIAPPVPLGAAEQLALVEFAQRAVHWTPARRVELADVLAPLTGADGDEGVERLVSMAAWAERRA
jgi:uncharacterized RDD family membrane protein YckC